MQDNGVAALARLPLLRRLVLYGCRRVSDAGLAHLMNAPSLRDLDLGACHNIGDDGMQAVSWATGLQVGVLARNAIVLLYYLWTWAPDTTLATTVCRRSAGRRGCRCILQVAVVVCLVIWQMQLVHMQSMRERCNHQYLILLFCVARAY